MRITDPDEWIREQVAGLERTLDVAQHQGLTAWMERQAHGGRCMGGTWGPRFWRVTGFARPQTTGHLSCHTRCRLECVEAADLASGTKLSLVWVNTTKWAKIK